ncbi:hypothetical protein [Sphingomonas jeddahensis]|uniref:hypothetical protein n=1 Tax=Sphingomonas jeddahensis TaxID=1915074 RepID=UPI000977556A|nr:hypothetical protein [Sphingomonas jeddahensis]
MKRVLAGIYSPASFVVLPAIASLPIMAVEGEGDFIVPVMGAMWAALSFTAFCVGRGFEKQSVRRACATGAAVWSLLLALAMFGMTMAFMADGGWG